MSIFQRCALGTLLAFAVPAAANANGVCNSTDVAAIKNDLYSFYSSGYSNKGTFQNFDRHVPYVETDGLHAITGVGGKGWFRAFYQRAGSRWVHVGGDINYGQPLPSGWEQLSQGASRSDVGYWDKSYPVWSASTFDGLLQLHDRPGCKNSAYTPPQGP
jgi:hypothetical protein